MFQTVAVNIGERISVKDNWLVIQTGDSQQRIPLSDIYAVIIDNQTCSLTVPSIHRLTDCGAHILKLKANLPPVGSVRIMQVTEKQYNAMEILVGKRTAEENFLTPKDFLEF